MKQRMSALRSFESAVASERSVAGLQSAASQVSLRQELRRFNPRCWRGGGTAAAFGNDLKSYGGVMSQFEFTKLDTRTRNLMSEEIASAKNSDELYYSARFTDTGKGNWPDWLLSRERTFAHRARIQERRHQHSATSL
jgi:hypothetical protein